MAERFIWNDKIHLQMMMRFSSQWKSMLFWYSITKLSWSTFVGISTLQCH